ncbi:DUF3108 domain-containing protein [Marinobacterium lutimaris]|uniref:DUF3108 domain-containing protein n=1 Tax=Marinobacterium lutimaris TaxID=568106 RepID=A0A1H6CGQ2_9GAMM|nr:DUF3108 domain-containing protein [Marinobacterium lutimaris]SEG72144.1 Protein of unknown function [Marinobacterium lutimaris]
MKLPVKRSTLLFLSLLTSGVALADDSVQACAEKTLGRYAGIAINYRVDWKGFSLDSSRTLDQLEAGAWKAQNSSSLLFMGIEEQSRFHMQGGLIEPQEYSYERKGLSKKHNVHLSFDRRGEYKVESPRGDDEIGYEGRIYDLLSHQMQLRVDLACKPPQDDYNYTIARRKGVSDYRYRYVGEDSVETPAGTFEAILLEKGEEGDKLEQIWLAPELNYLVVRFKHQEEDDEAAELLLLKRP